MDNNVPCVLIIGGLDPSGGAGLPADARAVSAFGAHPCGITTAIIAQNTRGVAKVEPVSPVMLAAQLDNLLEDIAPRAVKIGMLPNTAAAEVVAQRVLQLRDVPLIVDTVFAPSSGPRFAADETIRYIAEYLLPLADVVTPNIAEAEQLIGAPITDLSTMITASQLIHERYGARYVLLKGGHLPTNAVDVLFDGQHIVELRASRVTGYEVRGTGCLLASAIAAQRAHGIPVIEAAQRAKVWLTQQIQNAKTIGGGRRVATL
jgi:hydroxymethylpyrimidine/phosphomethylpyrimidine kinase